MIGSAYSPQKVIFPQPISARVGNKAEVNRVLGDIPLFWKLFPFSGSYFPFLEAILNSANMAETET